MKRLRRALVVLMAMVMTLVTCLPVMASSVGTDPSVHVTIEKQDVGGVSLVDRKFVAYQIFKGTQQTDPNKHPNKNGELVDILGDVEWGKDIDANGFLNALLAISEDDMTSKYQATNFITHSDTTKGTESKYYNPFKATFDCTDENLAEIVSTSADGAYAEDVALKVSERLAWYVAANPDTWQLFLDEVAMLAGDNLKVGAVGEEMTFTTDEQRKSYNLPLGYYLIVDETPDETLDDNDETKAGVRNASVLQLTTEILIQVKTSRPTLEKKIVEEDDKVVDSNNVSIGDTVNFQIETSIPDLTHFRYYKFVVTDVLSKGFTYNGDMVITLDGEPLTLDTDYVVKDSASDKELDTEDQLKDQYADGTYIKVIFKDFFDKYKDFYTDGKVVGEDGKVVITYSATLNKDAVIGTEGNPNKALLSYWRNPNIGKSGEPDDDDFGGNDPKGVTPEDVTYTFTTALRLTKIANEDNQRVTLDGATFRITGDGIRRELVLNRTFEAADDGEYYKLKDGSYTKETPNGDEGHDANYDSTTQKYAYVVKSETLEENEEIAYEIEVDENGDILVLGLKEGTYFIEETVAPLGYNKLKNPIRIYIETPKYNTADDGKTITCEWNGVQGMWKVDEEDPEGGSYLNSSELDYDPNLGGFAGGFRFDVLNNKGALLPRTGGIGTTIFYVVGGMLVVVAAVLLVLKRRASQKED